MPLHQEVILHHHMLQDGLTMRGSYKVTFGSINLDAQLGEARLPEFSRRAIGLITLILVEGGGLMNTINQFILEGFLSMLVMAGDRSMIAEMMAEGGEVIGMNSSILKDIWKVMAI